MILVTTNGQVGLETARLLAEQGRDVRVIARRPERAAALAAVGVDVVEGDLTDRASVDRAMQGVTSVVVVSLAVLEQELAVVDSAMQSGVAHVVKITSKASADSPIARRRDQYAIEQGLLGSGLGWTRLRSNAYMQNFLMLAPSIAAPAASAPPPATAGWAWSTPATSPPSLPGSPPNPASTTARRTCRPDRKRCPAPPRQAC